MHEGVFPNERVVDHGLVHIHRDKGTEDETEDSKISAVVVLRKKTLHELACEDETSDDTDQKRKGKEDAAEESI